MTQGQAVLAEHSDNAKPQNHPGSRRLCSVRLLRSSKNICGDETALHLARDVEKSTRLHKRLRHECMSESMVWDSTGFAITTTSCTRPLGVLGGRYQY